MYAVVSIHPETLHLSHRSFHQDYQEAVQALKTQVTEFITNYKKYQTVIFIDNKSEIKNHKNTKYFLKHSNKYPNRISIYEKRKTRVPGYLYTSHPTKIEKIKVFFVTEVSLPISLPNCPAMPSATSQQQWIKEIEQESQQRNTANISHIEMMEELKKQLADRREKTKFE